MAEEDRGGESGRKERREGGATTTCCEDDEEKRGVRGIDNRELLLVLTPTDSQLVLLVE